MKKKLIVVLIILMAVGFAAVSTSLIINGTTNLATNEADFDVYFSKASLDEEDKSDTIISSNGKTITFETKDLKEKNEKTVLEYDVTNSSSQYDAEIEVNCINDENEKVDIKYNMVSNLIKAKETQSGSITIELVKNTLEEETIELKCTLTANAVERDILGDGGESSNPEAASTYSIYGYLHDDEDNIIANENLVVYSEIPHYVTTDNRGYFYVEGLESGSHEIYYVGTKVLTGASKEEVKSAAIDFAEITTSTKNIVFNRGCKITNSTIENTLNEKVEIKFDTGDGNVIVDEITGTHNNKYGELPKPEKDGFTFEKWVYEDGTEVTSDTIISTGENHTLTAVYQENEYTINYDANGGIGSIESTTQKYSTEVTLTKNSFTRSGYNFIGWNTKSDGTGKAYTDQEKVSKLVSENNGSITLYAIWGTNEYIVTLDPNGGTLENNKITVTYDSTYGELETPVREGYTFLGWYLDDEKVDSTTKVSITSNVTLKAKWKAKEYLVILNPNGGTLENDEITVVYDSEYGELPIPTRTGYEFNGWYTEIENGEKIESTTIVKLTNTQNLYAKWSANEYTLTYDANGGNVSEPSKKVIYDSTYGELRTPTRTGYTFNGWYIGSTLIESGTKVSITSDSTITAKWVANDYSLKFDPNGGNVDPVGKDVTYGSEVGTLPTPTKTGYTFNGWFTSVTGGTKYESTTKVTFTEELTLYAQWTANAYTIKFNANGGSVSETSRSVTYAQEVGTLPTPTRTGYTFNGWYTSATGGTKYESTTKVSFTSETTIYAQWTANAYTLKFNANGGSVSEESRSVTYGSPVGTLPTPTRVNYTFNGWYTSATGGTKYESTTVVSFTSETTIYAQWTLNTFTVNSLGYTGTYDTKEHSISIKPNIEETTITYSTDGENYSTTIPVYSDVGEYKVYYKVEKYNYADVLGSETIKITPAENELILSETSGTITYPENGSLSVISNKSGGELTVSSSDTTKAVVSILNNDIIITPGTTGGTVTITIKSAATKNYKEGITTYTANIKLGTLDIVTSDYNGTFSQSPHSATVTCNTSGATIKYGKTEGNYNLTTMPTYANVGKYIVYYQVSKPGYKTETGSVSVTINQANGGIAVSNLSTKNEIYVNNYLSYPVNFATGTVSCSSSNNNIATCSYESSSIVVRGISKGTVTITLKAAESNNYKAYEKTYSISIIDPVLLSSVIKLGDTINMTPTVESYTIPTTLSGCAISTFCNGLTTQTINPRQLNKWRVLAINSDGTIDIISEYVTEEKIWVYGTQGGNNFATLMSNLTKQFENSKYTITSSSTKLPDNYKSTILSVLGKTQTTTPSGSSVSYWDGTVATQQDGSITVTYMGSTGYYESYYQILYNSSTRTAYGRSQAFRPIITLKSDITATTGGSSMVTNSWSLN